MTSDITPERIERLKTQVPPNTKAEQWSARVSCLAGAALGSTDHHVLRLMIADADAREAARPKEPPIPPGPEGMDPAEWRRFWVMLDNIRQTRVGDQVTVHRLAATHILAALDSYRPGKEMVQIEAFVSHRPESEQDPRPWLAVSADTLMTWHPDKSSALAAVRENVRKAMEKRNA